MLHLRLGLGLVLRYGAIQIHPVPPSSIAIYGDALYVYGDTVTIFGV